MDVTKDDNEDIIIFHWDVKSITLAIVLFIAAGKKHMIIIYDYL